MVGSKGSEVWKETWGTRGLTLCSLGWSVSRLVTSPAPGGKGGVHWGRSVRLSVEDSQPHPAPGRSCRDQHLASARPGARRDVQTAHAPRARPSPGFSPEARGPRRSPEGWRPEPAAGDRAGAANWGRGGRHSGGRGERGLAWRRHVTGPL